MVSELDRAKRALVTFINLWLLSVLLLWKWCGILMMLLHAGPSEECLAKFTQTGVETKPTRNVSTRLTKEEEPEEAEAKPQASLKPAEEWGRSPEDPHACYESSFEI